MKGQTFFLVQSVVREYLLVGETGGAGSLLVGYGGEMLDLVPAAAEGELVWYEGRRDPRRSLEEVRMRKGLLDLVGVLGLLM